MMPIVLNAPHLSLVLHELVAYDSEERPHRTLSLQTSHSPTSPDNRPDSLTPVLHRWHHAYDGAA